MNMRNFRYLPVIAYAVLLAGMSLLFLATPPHAQYPGYNNPGAYGPNKLRNSSLVSWFNGVGILSKGSYWCGEGVYAVATGASFSRIDRVANDLAAPNNNSVHACELTGNTSVSDVTVRWVIESYDAASLAGNNITCQFPIKNVTGSSMTPTITVKSGAAQDGTWTNVDVNGVGLGTVTNNATAVLTYTWAASATTSNGLSVDIDFGNNFGVNTNKVHIGGGFNCRSTPGFPVGTGAGSYVQPPDIPEASRDTDWNRRFFVASTANAVLPGSAGTTDRLRSCSFYTFATTTFNGCSFDFGTVMRATGTLNFWDGAGNSGQVSSLAGTVWTNAISATVTPLVTTTGFFFPITVGGGANDNLYLQYTSDATLLGN